MPKHTSATILLTALLAHGGLVAPASAGSAADVFSQESSVSSVVANTSQESSVSSAAADIPQGASASSALPVTEGALGGATHHGVVPPSVSSIQV
jgi:hypothetical protein